MSSIFTGVAKILRSESTDLKELALLVGVTPEELYIGANLSGVNLTEQDITFLVGLNAKYSNAILTDAQRDFLLRHDVVKYNQKNSEVKRSIQVLRENALRSYFRRYLFGGDDAFIEKVISSEIYDFSSTTAWGGDLSRLLEELVLYISTQSVFPSEVSLIQSIGKLMTNAQIGADHKCYHVFRRIYPEIGKVSDIGKIFDYNLLDLEFARHWVSDGGEVVRKFLNIAPSLKRIDAPLVMIAIESCVTVRDFISVVSLVEKTKNYKEIFKHDVNFARRLNTPAGLKSAMNADLSDGMKNKILNSILHHSTKWAIVQEAVLHSDKLGVTFSVYFLERTLKRFSEFDREKLVAGIVATGPSHLGKTVMDAFAMSDPHIDSWTRIRTKIL